MNKTRLAAVGLPMLVGALFLGLWQFLVTWLEVPKFLVPSPLLIAQTLVEDWALLWSSLLSTLKITFLAFFCAVVLGTLVAFVFVQSRLIETALFPYAVLLQVTPIVAIAPLIIIWVKNPTAALTVCATLVALFPIISNTTLGLRSVSPGLQNLFRMNKATRTQELLRLRIQARRSWSGRSRHSPASPTPGSRTPSTRASVTAACPASPRSRSPATACRTRPSTCSPARWACALPSGSACSSRAYTPARCSRTTSTSKRRVVANGQRGEIPGYTVWNLSANYDLSGPCNCTLFFTANNLSDKSYVADMTRGLIPGMPRLLQGGFEIRF